MIDWNLVVQLLLPIGLGLGAYVAIRSDLALMHERITVLKTQVENIQKRHDRIDDIMREDNTGTYRHQRVKDSERPG
jgi:Tfp pilus assembly protein PilN